MVFYECVLTAKNTARKLLSLEYPATEIAAGFLVQFSSVTVFDSCAGLVSRTMMVSIGKKKRLVDSTFAQKLELTHIFLGCSFLLSFQPFTL
jgi:hypothetical protein